MSSLWQVVTRSTYIHDSPSLEGGITAEMVFGETCEVLSDHYGFVKIRRACDSYEGFTHKDSLSDDVLPPTHKITALQSLLYKEPNYKTKPITALPFLSRIALSGEEEDGFIELDGGGWLWKDHLCPIEQTYPDMAATAERFIGLPYLWGGATARGLDCSGLVQLCAQHAGHNDYPRDSIDQIAIGTSVAEDNIQRGDLVFFEGHVGLVADNQSIINATARTMDVRSENLDGIKSLYNGGILAIQRI